MFSQNNDEPRSSQAKTSFVGAEETPDATFVHWYFILEPSRIALLRFILEGYDGIFFLRTLAPREGIVEVGCTLSCRRDALDILNFLDEEVPRAAFSPFPETIPPL